MRLSLIILSFSFLLYKCSNKNAVPKNVLSINKMQSVLWDVLKADEMASYYIQRDSSINNLSKHVELYQQIFQIHHITKQDFKKSIEFYESRPDLLKFVFDSLQKKTVIPVVKSAVDSLKKIAPPVFKKDSLYNQRTK